MEEVQKPEAASATGSSAITDELWEEVFLSPEDSPDLGGIPIKEAYGKGFFLDHEFMEGLINEFYNAYIINPIRGDLQGLIDKYHNRKLTEGERQGVLR